MKRTIIEILAGLAILSLSFYSCSLMSPQSGDISMVFTGVEARAVGQVEGAVLPYKYVRVYLESQGSLVSLDGKNPYYEAAIPSNGVVTVKDVPVMRNCTLYISTSMDGGASFQTVKYGVSESTFNVVAGGTADVKLTLTESPFTLMTSIGTQDASGVKAVSVNGTIYSLINGTVYNGATQLSPQPSGVGVINSLGTGKAFLADGAFGAEELWLNTSQGIYRNNGGAWVELTGLGTLFSAESPALESGVMTLTYDGDKEKNIAFYQRQGSVGGCIFDDEWEWKDLLDMKDSDINDLIKDAKSALIADYSISDDFKFGYVIIPAINTLRIDGDMIDATEKADDDGVEIGATYLIDNIFTDTISAPSVDGIASLIQSLSYANGMLAIGTSRGLFTISVNTTNGALIGSMQPASLGRRVDVKRVRSKVVGGFVYTAVLDKAGWVYILKDGSVHKEYRFHTGLPFEAKDRNAGRTADLFWTEGGLVISGTKGTVMLPNAKL